MKAVIMAGGMGKRLKAVSGDTPKPMVYLCGRPVMEYVLLKLKEHGITEVCAALQYRPNDITDYFGDGEKLGMKLSYHIEDKALGTAGGVKSCEDIYAGEDVLVVSGDAIFDFDLTHFMDEHRQKSPAVSIALSRCSAPLRYGLALCGEDGYVRSFIEKPDWPHVVTDLVNTGIYILSPEAMRNVPKDRPFDFAADLFPLLLKNGEKLLGVPLSGYWCDIGTPKSYYECCIDAISGKVSLPIREDFVQKSDECSCDEGEGCPCRDRARLMDMLSKGFSELGGDFSDGLTFDLGGEKVKIAPMSGTSALKISALSDSETAKELISSVEHLICETEKHLAITDE